MATSSEGPRLDLVGFTLSDLRKCAEREVAFRRNVYARRGMTPAREREIAMMEAIAELLRAHDRPTA